MPERSEIRTFHSNKKTGKDDRNDINNYYLNSKVFKKWFVNIIIAYMIKSKGTVGQYHEIRISGVTSEIRICTRKYHPYNILNNSMEKRNKKIILIDSIKNLNRLDRVSLPAFSAFSPSLLQFSLILFFLWPFSLSLGFFSLLLSLCLLHQLKQRVSLKWWISLLFPLHFLDTPLVSAATSASSSSSSFEVGDNFKTFENVERFGSIRYDFDRVWLKSIFLLELIRFGELTIRDFNNYDDNCSSVIYVNYWGQNWPIFYRF